MDNLGIGLSQREGHKGELSVLGQVDSETVEADSFAASPFQRDNNNTTTDVRRPEADMVEISREAQQRLLQEEPSPPTTGENKLVEEDDPLLIVTAQEKQKIEFSDPLDRANNETVAGRELGQILDQFS